MATIGLRDLYRAPITIGADGADEVVKEFVSGEITLNVSIDIKVI